MVRQQGRKVAFAGSLQLECARLLHEALFALVPLHGTEIIICRQKKRSSDRAAQMDNLKGLNRGFEYMDKKVVWNRVMKVFSDDSAI